MKKKINKIVVIFFVVLAITVTTLVTNVNAANIKENTDPNDTRTDTITDGTIIIGVSKFTPGTVVTGVKAAIAGSNDMKVYALTKGDTDGYETPKMYYYVLGEWMQYDEEGGLKGINAIDSLDIYYVNNQLKNGISLPTPPSRPSSGGSTSRPVECTVFFMTGEEEYESVTLNKGSKIKSELPTITSEDPDKKFGGWQTKEGEVVTNDTTINSSMVLFPRWNGPAGIEIVLNNGKPNVTKQGFVEDYVSTDIPVKEFINGIEYNFASLSIGEEAYEEYVIEEDMLKIKIPEPATEGSNTTISVNWTKKVTSESLETMESTENAITIDEDTTFDENEITLPETVETLNIEGVVTLPDNLTIGENVKTINIGANADVTISPSINFADDATVTKGTGAIVKQQVNDEETLQNAIAKTYVDEVVLVSDVSLTTSLEIAGKTLELKEKTINAEGIESGYAITTNGNAVLKNGTITTGDVSPENKKRTIYNTAGTLDLESMTVNGYYGITSDDGAGLVTIKDSTLNTEFAGVYAATGASVKVENSTINSDIYGLSGNGTKSNTTYEVNGSTITSKIDAAIYFPSTITLNVTDSTVSGKVGIEACAGDINVKNSTITSTETNAYTDEEIKAKFDTKANGTFIEDRSSGSAIFFRIQKPYGSNTTSNINVDANSTLNGTYGIRVYESSTSTNTDAVKELTINSLAERNDENAISIYRVVSNATINYSKTLVDLTQEDNNITTKSETFNSTYYNKEANQTITTVDDDVYYMNLGAYTGKANPTELYIEGYKYDKDVNSTLSIGNNSKITVPVWKISDEGNVLIALPWLCAEALPSNETTVVVGGQTFAVKLYDSEVDGTLTLTGADKFATKEGEVHNISITGENEVTVERSYKTEGVKFTFSKNNTPITDEAEYVYRMDKNNRMSMGITHPEGGATYAVFPQPYKAESVTAGETNTYVYKIAIPGKGVIEIKLNCVETVKENENNVTGLPSSGM